MSLFSMPKRADKSADSKLAKKINTGATRTSVTIKGSESLADRINLARGMVEKHLGKNVENYILIQDEETLKNYISECVTNNIVSIDTETTGLDPILDDIVGISLYTPNMQSAYIPINHRSYITLSKSSNQLSLDIIKTQLNRLVEHNTYIVMFNASFDIRVIKNQVGVKFKCDWDCYLAARLLNENEPSNALKKLHQKYVLKGEEDAFKFDELFKGITFDLIPIKTAYLYAANDSKITFELFEYQKPYLTPDNELCKSHNLVDVAWVFYNIEMPCVEVIVDMEDTGVMFDSDYAKELHTIYAEKYNETKENTYKILDMYSDEIQLYRSKHLDNKLSEPINLDSPTQIAIVLYDIMQIKPVDKDKPRGTGEEILTKINNDFTKSLLEYRGVGKLMSTYIDKLPECVNPRDNRIHCKFNQYGADTGRMSSSEPNLQNIPSHNGDIRKLFIASKDIKDVYSNSDCFILDKFCEVETPEGWKLASNLSVGDFILADSKPIAIKSIVSDNGKINILVEV